MKNLVRGITVKQVIGLIFGTKVITSVNHSLENDPYIFLY